MTQTGKTKYKSADALYIENKTFIATVTVRGSKLVSLTDKTTGRELILQSESETFSQPPYASQYSSADMGGFDEMFPTIDECFYEKYPWKGASLPDHGEVWSLDWDVDEDGDADALEMSVFGVALPYCISKKVNFTDEKTLRIDYDLINLSPFDMDFCWAAHAMFGMEDDAVVVMPKNCKNAMFTFSEKKLMGQGGDFFRLSDKFAVSDGNRLAFGRPEPVYMDKFYVMDELSEGRVGVGYKDGSEYYLTFPTETVPYLGVLVSKGMHLDKCAILEPCTAAFDRPDRAAFFGRGSSVKANDTYVWSLEISKA